MVPTSVSPRLIANGDAIRAIRQAMGWRLTKFAAAIDISHSFLANIEAGRRQASADTLRRIADTLHVPLTAIAVPRAPTDAA
jgi:transcriptional regulator with XRE-family HTH domain